MGSLSPIETWSDRIHPVIVKELRQTVRSGTAMWMLQGGGLVMTAVLIFRLGGMDAGIPIHQMVGRDLFLTLVAVLFVIASVMMVLNAGNRIMSERIPGEIDLLYTSPMTASGIIMAKLFCGLYDALLLFSIALPALFLTTLLRGVDVVTVLVCLLVAVPLLLGPLQVMIFVGALRLGKTTKSLLGMAGVGLAVPICCLIYFVCVLAMVRSGPGSFFTALFSGDGIGVMFVYVALFGVLHGMSVALVATPGGRASRNYQVREMDDVPNYRF